MSAKPILCVGALTADLVLQLPELPAQSGKYMAGRGAMVAAGMAASAATAAARLGSPVALWASAGDDMIGDFVVGEIAREGIDVVHIRRLPGVMSATAAIIVDQHGERMVIPHYDQALLSPPELRPDFSAYAAVLVDVRWPSAAAMALDGARLADIPAILDLDTGETAVLDDLASRATHIVASLAGARALTGAQAVDAALDALATSQATLVAITDGEKGVWWREGEITRHMPAFAVQAVDTNAAGDVFHGAFTVAIAEGLGLEPAFRLASAAAAIKCMRYGGRAGAPGRGETEVFIGGNSNRKEAWSSR